ncbi:MAG: hypothetical protein ACOYYI_02455 [Chloroflexota bacterium]
MNGFWLVSYIVLWLVAIGEGLVILTLAHEIEELHERLDTLHRHSHQDDVENQTVREVERER